MSDVVYALAMILLAGVFLASGVLKLAAPAKTRAGLAALRLPSALARPWFAIAWPVAEIAIAVLLVVPSPLHLLALIATAAASAVFLVVVVRALRLPGDVHCHCFGALDGAPVSASTVARNGALLALSLVALSGASHGSLAETVAGLGANAPLFQLGLFLLAVVAVVVLVQALRPAPAAAPAPAIPASTELGRHLLRDLFGVEHDVRRFVGEEQAVLFFVSTTCSACRALAPQIAEWYPQLEERGIAPWLVASVPAEEAISAFPVFGARLLHDRYGQLTQELGITSLPAAVHIGRDGTPTVSTGPAEGGVAIEALVDNVLSDAGVRR